MNKLLHLCAAGALALSGSFAAQAQGPGEATLSSNSCSNLQLLRGGQPMDVLLGMQLQQGDQVSCIGQGEFAVQYVNCELDNLTQHTVNEANCKAAGAVASSSTTPLPTVPQAGAIFAGSVAVSTVIAGFNDDDDSPTFVFDSGFSPVINQ